ncbi:MAG: four helix bundle protein [Bacteroidota bacterium]
MDITEQLPHTRTFDVVGRQLIRAGTSVGANVEEATAADSRRDFGYRMGIALREARETRYWLRIVVKRGTPVGELIQEAEEIMKILGSIVSKVRRRFN